MTTKNIAASVRSRLLNQARDTNRPFQELLQYYAMERFLYRLSQSPYQERFILKGALMLKVLNAPFARPTKDVDLLGYVENSVENLVAIIRKICQVEVPPDGISFDGASVSGTKIKEDADYQGVRIRFRGDLENAQIKMQIDIGFGDVITPAPIITDYPTLLNSPVPRLRVYPRETAVAEKFQAMVFLGSLNSRMKDFYDIWFLARQFSFEGPSMLRAIQTTFSQRGTQIETNPVAFRKEFATHEIAARQWTAFIKKLRIADAPNELAEVILFIATFLQPVAEAAKIGSTFNLKWQPPGPWH